MKTMNMISRRSFLKVAMAAATVSALGLTGCGSSASGTASGTASSAAASSAAASEAGQTFKVGIVNYVDHASLNQIVESVESRLDEVAKEKGVTFDYADYYANAQADQTNLNQIGADLVADGVDVIVAVATPTAATMLAAVEDTDIPVVYSAVTDPAAAGFDTEPNITGTSDALNTDAMEKNRNDILLALIRIARDAGVEWEDTLPITAQPPFRYTTDTPFQYPTTDEEGSPTTSLTRLGRLAVKMKWIDDPTADGAQGAPLPTAEELLEKMRIRNPEEVLEKYPHQLSGGMLQRIMIGIATAMKPSLLIADEPTTAIDAITQYEILNELLHIKENHNTAMIFISHDLNAISRVADRIVVLNHGAVVDRGDFQHILHHAQDPYTKLLVEKRADVMRRYTAVLNGKKETAHA